MYIHYFFNDKYLVVSRTCVNDLNDSSLYIPHLTYMFLYILVWKTAPTAYSTQNAFQGLQNYSFPVRIRLLLKSLKFIISFEQHFLNERRYVEVDTEPEESLGDLPKMNFRDRATKAESVASYQSTAPSELSDLSRVDRASVNSAWSTKSRKYKFDEQILHLPEARRLSRVEVIQIGFFNSNATRLLSGHKCITGHVLQSKSSDKPVPYREIRGLTS